MYDSLYFLRILIVIQSAIKTSRTEIYMTQF